jgi:hypothetical protein
MNSKQKSEILQTLGYSALLKIQDGNPQVINLGWCELVQFWLYGQECEYYFDTEPILLRQVEADKEFTTFDQLIKEIAYELA